MQRALQLGVRLHRRTAKRSAVRAQTCAYRCIVEGTPNPNARRITPVASDGRLIPVVAEDHSGGNAARFPFARFRRSEVEAFNAGGNIPLVEDLFAVSDDVEEVFLSSDFLSISLAEGAEWDDATGVSDALLDAIDEFFEAGPASESSIDAWISGGAQSVFSVSGHYSEEELQLIGEIQQVLEEKARPNLQADGGDVVFRGLKDGVVSLSMVGACASCPSSTVTMRFMLKNLLQHYFPDDVVDVVQHEDDVEAYNSADWTG